MNTIEAYSTPLTVRPATYGAIDRLTKHVRDAGRYELVHYAGAAHRDDFAWAMMQAFLAQPHLCEADLRVMAHASRGTEVSAADMRRNYSTRPGHFHCE